MRTDRKRKRSDLIVHCVGTNRIKPNHAVGQVDCGPRRHQQDAYIANSGVDILHLRKNASGEERQAGQQRGIHNIYETTPVSPG